ncbi:ommochrome-binding protein-like [Pieris napi]|uniref:ommochrome-binding protein-like n=1 Tax=Pieris napi TaxID=78633 RepID=UPI001FB9BAFF|nr:ommochrome-binding protein-like [Pieris napi]
MNIRFLYIIFICFCTVYSNEEKKKCEEVTVHDKPHRKHVLSMGLNRPYQLAFDKHHNKLFFSHNVGSDEEDAFEIAYIEKDQMIPKVVSSVKNGFAIAIDNKDGVIYYGGSDGIYKEHLKEKNAIIHEVLKEHNVWDMFFKHSLYFITYPLQHLYKLNEKKVEHQKYIHEKIYQFVIDGNDDIFITNETGLFLIKNGTEDRIFYKGPKVFRAIEVNNKGVAYFCSKNGIYVPNKKDHTLDMIARVKHIFGLAFDTDDNIIYSDPHEIVKLLPEKCK